MLSDFHSMLVDVETGSISSGMREEQRREV